MHIEAGRLVASTCKEAGHKKHYKCSVCGALFSDAEGTTPISDISLPLAEHSYGSLIEKVDATCSATGTDAHYKCSVCEKLFQLVDGSYEEKTANELVINIIDHVDDNNDDDCDTCGANMSDSSSGDSGAEKSLLATFDDFSKDGATSSSHSDGSTASTSTVYSDNSHTLQFTTLTNVSSNAFDEKGNSCLKLGTSKKNGSFTFKVSDDVKEVKIYVAKYKDNISKITINAGDVQSLTKSSNAGEYDVIIVDTSESKEITLSTASGGLRVMVDKIEYYG